MDSESSPTLEQLLHKYLPQQLKNMGTASIGKITNKLKIKEQQIKMTHFCSCVCYFKISLEGMLVVLVV